MNTLQLVWKNISKQWGSTALSILLTSFGVAILSVIYITSDTFEKQLSNNSKNVDLVIGAKGSPLQLILSSLYHVDNPTGNIPLSEASKIAANPLVQMAVPISLGDNFKGHRIVGTDTSFMALYELKLDQGRLWSKSFEIVVGADVARKQQLKLGDQIHGSHGLSAEAHIHDEHPFVVVGILTRSHTVVDNIILSDLASIWEIHGIAHDHEGEHEAHEHTDHADHAHKHTNHAHIHSTDHSEQIDTAKGLVAKKEVDHQHSKDETIQEEELVSEKPTADHLVKNIGQDMLVNQGVEITALLVKYSSPAAIATLPRLVNQSTQMQAASPAIESSRLFSLLGVGLDSLAILAYVIMFIAALSVFISLYNALKGRKYDLAIMRTMGASRNKLFTLVVVEGLVITSLGGLLGIILGHAALYYISIQTSQSADFIQAFTLYPAEFWIIWSAVILGFVAAIIPAVKAYNTSISEILASK